MCPHGYQCLPYQAIRPSHIDKKLILCYAGVMTTRTKPRLKMEAFQCSNCGKTKVGFYPRRVSVVAKMSRYKFCSPQCQQAHWRQRRRRIPRPPTYCGHCGNIMPWEDRPGRPRRYCSPSHQQAAANRRRPVTSPAIAVLEDAVLQADRAVRAARAAVDVQIEKVAAAKRLAEQAKTERLRTEADTARFKMGVDPAQAGQQAVAASLALVSRLTAAHRNLVAAGPDDKQHREEVFHQLYAEVDADRVATLQVEVLDAENRRGLARAAASSAAAAAESARAALQTARNRLDRRAQQARDRRARGRGGDPEEIEPGEIETESEGIEPAPDAEETAVFPSWSRHAQG